MPAVAALGDNAGRRRRPDKKKATRRPPFPVRSLFVQSAAILGAAASSASLNRGGDIGRSVMRTPVARAIALPTAAVGGTIGTSPTPRTP
jgi:hypothetical protein